jgi:hypothetical protein
MKLELIDARDCGTVVVVTLSLRNVLSLLHKVELPGSARMLMSGHGYREGELADDLLLLVCVEDDGEHYRGREGPGVMHPETERFISERRRGPGEV